MDEKIIKMIEDELKNANEKFPLFNSMHEAYAVMKEEFEEAKAEFDDIEIGILKDYWNLTKNNKYLLTNENNLLDCLDAAVIRCIKELIQVGAMVRKTKLLTNQEK